MPSEEVLKWLQKTGFPLEMEAAAAFRRVGFDVRQSFTFPDPQSDKGREIDVLAQDPDFFGVIEISFVLECKSSPNPWVVLVSDDAFSNYNRLHAFAVTSGAARSALTSRILNLGGLKPYLERSSRGGYSFRQAFGKESDPAYSAAMGALKASAGVAQDRESSTVPRLAFAFPVVVVNSPLFECSLRDDGTLELMEVEQSEFLMSAYVPDAIGCSVRVIKKSRLDEFARWARQVAYAKKVASHMRRRFGPDVFAASRGNLVR